MPDFTRVDELRREEFKFDDWVLNSVKEQSEQLPEIVRFECELGLGDLEAKFDSDRMMRVLANMLSNASQAMVGKSGEAEDVITQNPLIKVSSQKPIAALSLRSPTMAQGWMAKRWARFSSRFFN